MKDLTQCASVQAWREDYVRHWGSIDQDFEQKLEVLKDFCQLVGKDPEAIVTECLREAEVGKRIRVKARRRYMTAIEEFEASHKSGRAAGNVVRSFLIHNGIAMTAGVIGG